ncbi:DUF4427 domain-containing protein [Clostridium sp. DJ247]|uniref:DUF4427 domain-containing protein n=1 Tax=Clostridium sp. DJ247 TaxID=2726188 RepID=UPI0016262474|nr:DUF4427 domain-containing protein [Clostridium sp. DJ247]MBC2579861.1 DUF4427 domain-containing protein [Clostridium sp. DJ247]
MKNNYRYDLSDKLIHFFRPLNTLDDSAPALPEHWGFGNINEGENYPAIFLLRCAIRHCRLWATWSYRKGCRTIYGPYPATCFTEMPLAAFIEASINRAKKGEKISTYALIFRKDEIYNLGARNVIYGLSQPDAILPVCMNGGERIIDPKYLPLKEQYRYVTYNPIGKYPIDWTHEREWRLPHYDDITDFINSLNEFGVVSEVSEIPGFQINNSSISQIGIVISKKSEIPLIVHDVLSLVDRNIVNKGTFKYIICNELINNIVAFRDPANENQLINESIINLDKYFMVDKTRDLQFVNSLEEIEEQIENSSGKIEFGEYGCCWLWIYDTFHDFTRALINEDRIIVNKDGKYLYYPESFYNERSLRQKEKMVKELASVIKNKFGVNCGYFSVLNSYDPNEVPFYNEDIDNPLHYNCSYDKFE